MARRSNDLPGLEGLRRSLERTKIEIERDRGYHATIDELITYLGLEEFAEGHAKILG